MPPLSPDAAVDTVDLSFEQTVPRSLVHKHSLENVLLTLPGSFFNQVIPVLVTAACLLVALQPVIKARAARRGKESVPRPRLAWPSETALADPEEEPPLMRCGARGFGGVP